MKVVVDVQYFSFSSDAIIWSQSTFISSSHNDLIISWHTNHMNTLTGLGKWDVLEIINYYKIERYYEINIAML